MLHSGTKFEHILQRAAKGEIDALQAQTDSHDRLASLRKGQKQRPVKDGPLLLFPESLCGYYTPDAGVCQ